MEINVRPVPIPDPVTQFFWDSAKEGKLSVQGFAGTDILQHPPSPASGSSPTSSKQIRPSCGVGCRWRSCSNSEKTSRCRSFGPAATDLLCACGAALNL